MADQPFLAPILKGTRFDGGVIPLEILPDLTVLGEMVVEVAKWKFKEANPKRSRAPKGFNDSFSFTLTDIEDGSAKPIIKLVVAAITLFGSDSQHFLEQAREAIIGAIGAAEHQRPITQHLPQKFLGYFDKFGRNLKDDESFQFVDAAGKNTFSLTQSVRRKLVLASSVEEISQEISICGLVHDFDQRNRTFQLTLPNGAVLPRIAVESQHYDAVLDASYGYRSKLRIRIHGIGQYDRNDRLIKVERIEQLTILDPLDLRFRLDEIKQLLPGWLDGVGSKFDPVALDWLADGFDAHYSDDVPLPFLFPTPEGKILAEWSLEPWAASMEIDPVSKLGGMHVLNLTTDADNSMDLDLSKDDQWAWLVKQIRSMSGVGA